MELSGNFFHQLLQRSITGLSLVGIIGILYFFFPPLLSFFFLSLCLYVVVVEWPQVTAWCMNYWYKFILFWYIVFPFLLLIALNQSPQRELLLLLLSMVFIFDSSSYLIGSLAGRTRLWPSLTPKKTWEGLIGGFLFTIGVTFFLLPILGGSSKASLLPFALVVCLLAFVGDLFESFLKRKSALKDIGDILPGHGGMLDRFDSIMLVSYFFYFFRESLMSFLGL